MTDTVDLEQLVDLEQTFYDQGYQDGFAHGRIHGLIEGRAVGREKGFEIWEEIGFYQGFASTWDVIYAIRKHHDDDQSRRAAHHVHHLLDLIRRFPTVNPSSQTAQLEEEELDMSKLQRQIRSRYKALCASLGIRPTLRAGSQNAGEGHSTSAKRDLWTLDDNVRRPTIPEGLSF